MGLLCRAARVPEGREEVENGGEGSRALCLRQSRSEPLPNPMLTQSAAEVILVIGWLQTRHWLAGMDDALKGKSRIPLALQYKGFLCRLN